MFKMLMSHCLNYKTKIDATFFFTVVRVLRRVEHLKKFQLVGNDI